MYVDNELTAQQRAAVGNLMRSRTPISKVKWICCNRQSCYLMMTYSSRQQRSFIKRPCSIGAENHEEYFLNYIDEELDATGRQEVENLCYSIRSSRKHSHRFKQAKLEPEVLVF